MSSNRPFFSNFWATFRAHSATLPKSNASISTTSSAAVAVASTHSQTVWSSTPAINPAQSSPTSASAPRAINSKTPSSNQPTTTPARRNRRGSDSSSEGGMGYRDVLGAEKWYVGGRTAAGEERFYKLSMVRRDTSADRLSADRLSL
ncbi:hypothetical protein M436DRAFT_38895 [Aureobasidium namibiae CBS 147.97]|uniref:Uncharacterized protein n=1 Tax=Aureobasidium namibiae CBS 147.97 TaxID=1043004 RepID=A0A074XR86_9PEZI|nr:uncharacterized protein M436DRAFT_38895 [Aureobasidium namibiae CBS 147.97]KEQ77091.1 hypothetical protein M436DRAFT_38895 [Aureobasidium namibiae CBS 147.97]